MDLSALKKLVDAGLSQREIAKAMGTSKTTVQRCLRKLKSEDVYKVIVIPDPHVPHEDKRSMRALESYMRDETFDEWVCLGDLNDFDFLYKLDKTYLKTIEEHTFKFQYEKTNDFLDRHQGIILSKNPHAKFTVIEGNHDVRPDKFMEIHTETAGILGVEKQLNLKQRSITWVPQWSQGTVYDIGKASFIHGHTVNKYHASKTAEDYARNIFYGHTHDVQCHSKIKLGDHQTIVGQSLGCLIEYNPPYMQGRPSKWQQAFGVFWFFDEGYFSYQVVRIIDSAFVAPNGRIYRG